MAELPKGQGLWLLACWDCRFESRREHGCLCLLWVLWVVRYRSRQLADPSSRGFVPSAVCYYVWRINLKNEETLARGRLKARGKMWSSCWQYNLLLKGRINFCSYFTKDSPHGNMFKVLVVNMNTLCILHHVLTCSCEEPSRTSQCSCVLRHFKFGRVRMWK